MLNTEELLPFTGLSIYVFYGLPNSLNAYGNYELLE